MLFVDPSILQQNVFTYTVEIPRRFQELFMWQQKQKFTQSINICAVIKKILKVTEDVLEMGMPRNFYATATQDKVWNSVRLQ